MARIPSFYPGCPGSIPGQGTKISLQATVHRCCFSKITIKKKKSVGGGFQPKSNSESQTGGEFNFLGHQGFFSSPRCLKSPTDLLLRVRKQGQEGPLTLGPPGCALSSSSSSPQASDDVGAASAFSGSGITALDGTANAQGSACPVHRADPGRPLTSGHACRRSFQNLLMSLRGSKSSGTIVLYASVQRRIQREQRGR